MHHSPREGPCFQEGWEGLCPENALPCYKDCCTRGVSFCNHSPRQQRCQKCETREQLCGNHIMPWQCDAYCLNKTIAANESQVNPVYMYSTYTLSFLVLLLASILAKIYCNKSRKRHFKRTAPASSSINKSETVSLATSAGEYAASGSSTTNDSGFKTDQSAALLDEEEEQTKATTTVLPTAGSVSLNPFGLSVPASGNEETLRLVGQCVCPGDSTAGGQQVTHTPQSYHLMPSPPPPAEHQPRHGACHDPRLDNITPSSDADRSEVHTGMAPFRPNYSTDNCPAGH